MYGESRHLKSEMRAVSKFCSLLLVLCNTNEIYVSAEHSLKIYLPGKVMLAGLSPIHYPPGYGPQQLKSGKELNDSWYCGGSFNIRGLQHAEAIVYAVEQINAKKTLLPGITLGVNIRDTCNSVDYAVREALRFSFVLKAYRRAKDDTHCGTRESQNLQKEEVKTVAVVGAAYSGISMAIASLAGLFYVPVISYASTSRLLNDRARFKYFLRTVPSDNLQVQAMVELIKRFGWNFVSTVASDTEYGRSGMDAFKSAPHVHHNICIAEDALFTIHTPKRDVIQIISRIRKHSKARVIILFAELNDAQYFIQTAKEENLTDYIWVGSDAFAGSYKVLKGNEDVLKYWLATVPQSDNFEPFRDYFRNITDERKRRNPWLSHYEENVKEHLNSSDPVEYSPYTTNAIDAVYAVAHGLHTMYKCTEQKCHLDTINQSQVYKYIRNVSFKSPTGHKIVFDANGTSGSAYSIYYVNHTAGKSVFSIFGKWNRSYGFQFIGNNEKFDASLNELRASATCSSTCGPGYRKEPQKYFPECCWDCLPCPDGSVTNQSGLTTCTTCPEGFKANAEKSVCEAIEPTVILDTVEGITVLGACALGVASVFATLMIFCRHRESAVVRASSRVISYILLLGLGWCYLLPVVFVIQPSPVLCRMQPFLLSNGVALVIGPLLTKTSRIARIFSLNTMRTGRAHFLSNKWQLVFTGSCFLLENSIAMTWMVVSPARLVHVPNGNEEVSIECEDDSRVGFAVWATFNVGLLLLCTYQAFLVRKVPENYNEAKFIAFTMVTICICGAVYVPTYFGTHGVYRKILTCFLLFLCSTVSLMCLFGTKLYIILFRPAKNQPFQPKLAMGVYDVRPPYCRSTSGISTVTTLNVTMDTTSSLCSLSLSEKQPPK